MTAEPAVKLHAATAEDTATQSAPEAHAVEPAIVGKRLIRLKDLFALLDVKKATGHRLIAAGKIGPRAIRLTSACVRFDAEEVDAWLSTRKSDGNLHDATSWPPVWESLKRKRK
jgi:predicted DNA-binding transcriptional regulator AlpA